MARDRIGVGGLYLHRDGQRLWFANEIVHLLALLPARPAPDRASVRIGWACPPAPAPHTLYEGIERLEPGCLLSSADERREPQRYWQPRFQAPEIAPARRSPSSCAARSSDPSASGSRPRAEPAC